MNFQKSSIQLCLLLLVLFPGYITAQSATASRTLTLEEACVLAEQNNISLQKQAIDLEMDRIRAKSLWAEVFPSITATGELSGTGAGTRGYYIPRNDNVQRPDPLYTARFSVNLGFTAGLPFTMARISLAYKNSLLNYEQARRLLINQISKSFFSLLALKNNLTVLEGTMRLATEQLGRDRIARQNGSIGELDYLSAQVSSERANLAYNRALADYQSDLGHFLLALGMDTRETVNLEGQPEIVKLSLDPEQLINERLPQRPDIIAQRNEIQRLKNARTETFLSTKGPDLSLSATLGANHNNGFDDLISVGVSVSISVDSWVPRSKKDQTVKRANADYKKAQLELQNLENNIREEIRSYAGSIGNAWTEVEISRLQAGYAQRAYELAERAYRAGSMNFYNFETARNRYTEACQQQLQSELNYKILVLDLASALNIKESELQNYSR